MADLHLGKRAQGRVAEGRNQRELDVEVAFARAVQVVIDEQPDLLTIAGDCFDTVRPSMHAIRAYQNGIRRVVEETPAHVIVIPGNHCGPRTVETLTPNVVIDGMDRVSVVMQPMRLSFEASSTQEQVSVACLPFVAMQEERTYEIAPDTGANLNVLLVHAAVRTSAVADALSPMYAGPDALDVGALADEWDVIACGDYHDFLALHPSRAAFYSGSIERVSSDIWKEDAPKGVVVGDTFDKTFRLVSIPTREMRDIDFGTGASAEAVNAYLAELLTTLPRDMLVRLKVEDFPRGERDSIEWDLVRRIRDTQVHFRFDVRFADRDIRDLGDRRERVRRTLADEAHDYFGEDAPEIRSAAFELLGIAEVAA